MGFWHFATACVYLAGVAMQTALVLWVVRKAFKLDEERSKRHEAMEHRLLSRYTAVANLDAEMYCAAREQQKADLASLNEDRRLEEAGTEEQVQYIR